MRWVASLNKWLYGWIHRKYPAVGTLSDSDSVRRFKRVTRAPNALIPIDRHSQSTARPTADNQRFSIVLRSFARRSASSDNLCVGGCWNSLMERAWRFRFLVSCHVVPQLTQWAIHMLGGGAMNWWEHMPKWVGRISATRCHWISQYYTRDIDETYLATKRTANHGFRLDLDDVRKT